MEDYKKRMVEEFNQLRERTGKLEKLLRKHAAGKLDFELNCPVELLKNQYDHMWAYMKCLKQRAIIEDIDLDY